MLGTLVNPKASKLRPSGMFAGPESAALKDPRAQFLRRCALDVNFYFKCIGFDPTWQQRQLVDALVAGDSNIAVRSGKGPGKTACTAALVPWWALTNLMGQAVITAPTMAQCKNVWLSQAQKWVMDGDSRVKYFFNFTGTGFGIWGHSQSVWGGYLRTATTPEGFQGIHNERLLIYCEEASGIGRPIMQAIQDTLTGQRATKEILEAVEEDKARRTIPVELTDLAKRTRKQKAKNIWMAVGNPNTRTCRFFDFFHTLAGNPWTALHWNAEETPITNWFSGERNTEIAEEFGKDSDVYRVAVKGDFPSLDPDSLISEDDLAKCWGPEAYERAFNHPSNRKQIGIDLARYGGDECVNVFTSGRVLLSMECKSRVDPNIMIDRAVFLQDQYKWANNQCMYVVDTSGMGESAVGNIGGAKKLGKQVHEFYSQNRAHEHQKYANKITEAWCGFAKMVRSGDLYLGDKPDRKLVLQLVSRKYLIDKEGLIRVETKDEYKKRNADQEEGDIGKSPDRADAVIMSFYEHATQSQRIAFGG